MSDTGQEMKFFAKDFFSKCHQIRRKLRIWSHLLKKSVMENFIFCAVHDWWALLTKYVALCVTFFTPEIFINSRDIQNCLSKCCSAKDCDMAYLVNHQQCFSVKCFTPELCQIADEPLKHRMIEISKLIKAKKKRRIKRSKLFKGTISIDINPFRAGFPRYVSIFSDIFQKLPHNTGSHWNKGKYCLNHT